MVLIKLFLIVRSVCSASAKTKGWRVKGGGDIANILKPNIIADSRVQPRARIYGNKELYDLSKFILLI